MVAMATAVPQDLRADIERERSAFLVRTIGRITHNRAQQDSQNGLVCGRKKRLRGRCTGHYNYQFAYVPCKARKCKPCNRRRRQEHADRIAYGIRQFMNRGQRVAFMVGTFDQDVTKEKANRRKNYLVQKIQNYLGWDVEHAVSWEEQRTGRLHFNMVVGPWSFIPHSVLKKWWGARISVNEVRDSGAVGVEAVGAYWKSPETLASYVAKEYQQVETGKTVNYSKGWWKLPKDHKDTKGEVVWGVIPTGSDEAMWLDYMVGEGRMEEVIPGRGLYRLPDSPEDERFACDCFEPVGFVKRPKREPGRLPLGLSGGAGPSPPSDSFTVTQRVQMEEWGL